MNLKLAIIGYIFTLLMGIIIPLFFLVDQKDITLMILLYISFASLIFIPTIFLCFNYKKEEDVIISYFKSIEKFFGFEIKENSLIDVYLLSLQQLVTLYNNAKTKKEINNLIAYTIELNKILLNEECRVSMLRGVSQMKQYLFITGINRMNKLLFAIGNNSLDDFFGMRNVLSLDYPSLKNTENPFVVGYIIHPEIKQKISKITKSRMCSFLKQKRLKELKNDRK